MRIYVSIVLAVLVFAAALAGCGDSSRLTLEEKNDLFAGVTEEETVDGALTVILCGSASYDVEVAVSEFERMRGVDVNVIKYGEGDWEKFATKVLSQDSDFDLFMPVAAQLGSVIRNGIYQDLSGYESISTRIRSNRLTNMISVVEGELIGVPCSTQLFCSKDAQDAMTLFKYCYKNINLYTGKLADPDGEELFEMLKHHYEHPDDSRENAFYDFEYNDAMTSYVFMNKFSQRKDQAADFLCVLFDVLNKDVETEQTVTLPYPEVEADTEYVPDWLFYSYDFVEPIGGAFFAAEDSDGSDEALRRLAQEAAKGVKMRLDG